jgi:hypothetical protein
MMPEAQGRSDRATVKPPVEPSDPPRGPIGAGLCDSCRHQRLVANTRGSVFSLCELSRVDPAFERYPRLPVRSCAGYEPRPGEDPASTTR